MIIYIPMYEKNLTKHDKKNKNKKILKKNFEVVTGRPGVVLWGGCGVCFPSLC